MAPAVRLALLALVACVALPAVSAASAVKNDEPAAVKEWLDTFGRGDLAAAFAAGGYDTLESCSMMDWDEDLAGLEGMKKGFKKVLLAQIEKLKDVAAKPATKAATNEMNFQLDGMTIAIVTLIVGFLGVAWSTIGKGKSTWARPHINGIEYSIIFGTRTYYLTPTRRLHTRNTSYRDLVSVPSHHVNLIVVFLLLPLFLLPLVSTCNLPSLRPLPLLDLIPSHLSPNPPHLPHTPPPP